MTEQEKQKYIEMLEMNANIGLLLNSSGANGGTKKD